MKSFIVSFFLIVSCASQPPSSVNAYFGADESQNFLIWPSANVSVCWEPDSQDLTDEFATYAQGVITSQYSRAGISVVGWERCTDGDMNGIRISVNNNTNLPHCKTLGSRLAGMRNGMVILSTTPCHNPNHQEKFQEALCKDGKIVNQKISDAYVSSTLLHEFGHALGMEHEHSRADSTSDMKESDQGLSGSVGVGAYDKDSIMGYSKLNEIYTGWIPKLSDQDIAALRDLYVSRLSANELVAKYSGSSITPTFETPWWKASLFDPDNEAGQGQGQGQDQGQDQGQWQDYGYGSDYGYGEQNDSYYYGDSSWYQSKYASELGWYFPGGLLGAD